MISKLKQLLSINSLILIAVLIAGLYIQNTEYRFRDQIQNVLFDSLNRAYPRIASDQVVIVDIDEQSLDRPELGQWPWPRPLVADLIAKLNGYNVKAIGFDMVFAEADNTSPEQIAKAWRNSGEDEVMIKQIMRLESHDKIMAKTIRSAKNVILGLNFEARRATGSFGFTPRPKASLDIADETAINRYVYPFDTVANYPILSRFSYGEGHFYAIPDGDGIYRRVPMVMGIKKKNIRQGASVYDQHFFYPSLTAEMLRFVAQSKELSLSTDALSINGAAQQFTMPLDENGRFYVWYAQPQAQSYISAYDVLNNKAAPERLKDKIVLIGTSAIGLKDIRSTPMGINRPGVEVHLNIIDQALQGAYIQRPASIVHGERLALLVAGLLMFIAASRLALMGQTLIMAAGIAGFLIATIYGYIQYGLLIDGAFPAFVLFLLYVVSVAIGYLSSEQDRQKVRDAFGHYISPSYMKELTQNPDKLALGGEEKIITTMFSDIRGFTSICEDLTPDEIISLMNDFLTPLSDAIMERRGTIDKYMGDAIMAFWNAPIDDDEHALNACYTALEMQRRLGVLNAARQSESPDVKALRAGIGINTGLAAVGNMGSQQRFAYSALGDSVNLASRLEMQTKHYQVDILLGGECLAQNGVDKLAVLELDQLRVVGRAEPVRIYALLGDESYADSAVYKQQITHHRALLKAYRAQEWDQASALIKTCLDAECSPELTEAYARIYDFYTKRIAVMRIAQLPEDWDGVYTAHAK
jgi:adenylate cyclase